MSKIWKLYIAVTTKTEMLDIALYCPLLATHTIWFCVVTRKANAVFNGHNVQSILIHAAY